MRHRDGVRDMQIDRPLPVAFYLNSCPDSVLATFTPLPAIRIIGFEIIIGITQRQNEQQPSAVVTVKSFVVELVRSSYCRPLIVLK